MNTYAKCMDNIEYVENKTNQIQFTSVDPYNHTSIHIWHIKNIKQNSQ